MECEPKRVGAGVFMRALYGNTRILMGDGMPAGGAKQALLQPFLCGRVPARLPLARGCGVEEELQRQGGFHGG
jgi:hypothetical protein